MSNALYTKTEVTGVYNAGQASTVYNVPAMTILQFLFHGRVCTDVVVSAVHTRTIRITNTTTTSSSARPRYIRISTPAHLTYLTPLALFYDMNLLPVG